MRDSPLLRLADDHGPRDGGVDRGRRRPLDILPMSFPQGADLGAGRRVLFLLDGMQQVPLVVTCLT